MREDRIYHTRGGYTAHLQMGPRWVGGDFAWLGTIDLGDGRVIGWAWLWDGRSIDLVDPGFDLVDFLEATPSPVETAVGDG